MEADPKLFDFGLDITLREMLNISQLEVHLSQPHQYAVSSCLKLLPLANKVLESKQERNNLTNNTQATKSNSI